MKKNLPSYTTTIKKNIGIDEKLDVIILSGGEPYGMKTFYAKPLFTINGIYLLELQIDTIHAAFPKSEITVVLGYNLNKVVKNINRKYRIIENNNYENMHEAEQIRLALNSITSNNVLIINGDILFNNDIKKINTKENILVYSQNMHQDCCGVTIVDNKPTILSLDINYNKFAEILLLKDKNIEIIKQICSQPDRKRMYFFEIVNLLIKKVDNINAQELCSIRKIVSNKDIS